jgi:OHCU decarboxylase
VIKLKEADLLHCCGSTKWAHELATHSFPNPKEVYATADSVWWSLGADEWKEAFRAHPKIGERPNSNSSRQEQSTSRHASEETMVELRNWNAQYEARFGYIFIICASGKSAHSILEQIKRRIVNDPAEELRIAAEEQRQITRLRLAHFLNI